MSATAHSGEKTSEFAQLFDFFSRLASGDRDLFVPKEFESLVDALPVSPTSSTISLPGLCRSPDSTATSISLPSVEDEDHETTQTSLKKIHTVEEGNSIRRVPMPRGRRTSIAVVRGRGVTDRLARRFPLADGTSQQFTFKLMIHELYDINDFAVMVQEVLAASQKQFQPLPDALKRRESIGEEMGRGASGGKFPKGLGLGRPSGLDVPAAERALKKRRIGRRRIVSGGPMEKEPDWIDVASLPNVDVAIDDVPRITIPIKATTTSVRPLPRTRKLSTSARIRSSSIAQRRTPLISPAVKEAPVVKYAETFLKVPGFRGYATLGARRFAGWAIERACSEEAEFGEMPMSAPCTRNSFDVAGKLENVKAKNIRVKRRLSFST